MSAMGGKRTLSQVKGAPSAQSWKAGTTMQKQILTIWITGLLLGACSVCYLALVVSVSRELSSLRRPKFGRLFNSIQTPDWCPRTPTL